MNSEKDLTNQEEETAAETIADTTQPEVPETEETTDTGEGAEG